LKYVTLLLLTAAIGIAQDASRILVTRTEAAIVTQTADPSGTVTTTREREVRYQTPDLRIRQEVFDGQGDLKQVLISNSGGIGIWSLDPARKIAKHIAGGPGSTGTIGFSPGQGRPPQPQPLSGSTTRTQPKAKDTKLWGMSCKIVQHNPPAGGGVFEFTNCVGPTDGRFSFMAHTVVVHGATKIPPRLRVPGCRWIETSRCATSQIQFLRRVSYAR
jgi:hypothetical protein